MTSLDRLEALEREATESPVNSVEVWLRNPSEDDYLVALRNAAPALLAVARAVEKFSDRLDCPEYLREALACLTPEATDA